MDAGLIIIISISVLVVVIASTGIRQVPQSQAIIIERLGKYHKTIEAGLNFVIPFLDQRRFVKLINFNTEGIGDYNIDLREQVYDIPSQSVITKDNISLSVDTLVFYQIVEPYKSCYEISNLSMAIKELCKTTMRNIFGEIDLDSSLSARDAINVKLRNILDDATDKWGVKILRVEIQDITPPEDLKQDMEKQMKAERSRRQGILIAEGQKQATILEAEGIKQSQILAAQGKAEAMMLNAEAEKKQTILIAEGEAEQIKLVQQAKAVGLEAVRMVFGEAEGVENLIVLEILKSQNKIAKELANGNSQKIYLPTDIAGMFGAIGGIKELLKTKEDIKSTSSLST